ncbi:hypothetical protein C2U70_19400 [Bradyrhizobium guangdongense]|uniref:hypothetical protein n=1 Tax=Bradyrhizobium guangdongense TaxID=1325090 RepID=UPI00112C9801|nr:hypothetical protein [Bradyrhizobium guangdongense]TPQ33366.1 hypothetical protein C2U70_19400 [Bradyrhizobium guangdongense]
MSHLILTTNGFAPRHLREAGIANVVLGFYPRFVRGPLPPDEQLLTGLEPRSAKHRNHGEHWLDDALRSWLKGYGTRDIGLFALCEKFDSIEIWVDPQANDQLVLAWLLDLLRSYKEITTKLSLVYTDDAITKYHPQSLAKWKLPVFKVGDGHLTIASRVWHAWRAPTPEPCFDLLAKDLTILPRLRPALITMLEELPDVETGLGENEMGMLGWIEDEGTEPQEVLRAAELRELYNEGEADEMLCALMQCRAPAFLQPGATSLDQSQPTGPFDYEGGPLVLTELGRAVVAGEEDFSRRNPIHRWWGGTELTNERLWRWDRKARSLIAP